MDFITDLPKTKNGNTAILTCIDAATRRGRFIACKLAGLTAEKTANLVRQGVIRQHGIPKLFITDRGRQFINKFWKHLGKSLGFEQCPTTTAHQQGNGLAERIKQPLEAYLRTYVNFEQNDWDEYLDLFEFCWNNSKHASTGMPPFYADQGYLPNFQIKPEEPGDEITMISAAAHCTKINQIMTKLKSIMADKTKCMGKYYNQSHEDLNFVVGDWVMLKTDHLRTAKSCKKLTERQIGPFEILEKITNQTYKLDLRNLIGRIHDTFHIEKLEKYKKPQHGQKDYGTEWVVNDDETYKHILDIIDSKLKHGTLEYQVLWSDMTKEWISSDQFSPDDTEIVTFHNLNPENPSKPDQILRRSERTKKPTQRYDIQ